MTPDEKKAEEVIGKIKEWYQKAYSNSGTRGEIIQRNIAVISDAFNSGAMRFFLEALTEARQEVAKQKDERIAELEDQASRMQFVPGHSECPKCGFHLVQSILHPNGISPNLETPQQCPNDGTEMISVSWIKHSQNMQKGQEAILERAVRAESTNAEMEKEKLNLLTCAANQAEEISTLTRRVKELESELNAWFKQCTSLKAEKAKLEEWNMGYQKDLVEMSSRLSEALGALKIISQSGSYSIPRELDGSDQVFTPTAEALVAKKFLSSISNNARLLERDRARGDVIHWAQAVLTALNVGDVKKDSLLHEKLREIMIAYREALESHEKEGGV